MRPHNRQLAVAVRVIQPVVQAAALDRVVQLARAVAGEDGHRRDFSADGAQLRNADLVLAQVLEQKRFEGFVGAVHLVDQQHRAGGRRLQRLQERAANQVAALVDLALNVGDFTAAFGSAHVQQLRGVIPFVERFALLQAVIALQADQFSLQRQRQRFGQLGLADARLAFKQERTLQAQGQKYGRGQAPVGKVAGLLQGLGQGIDAGKKGFQHAAILRSIGRGHGSARRGARSRPPRQAPPTEPGGCCLQPSARLTPRWVCTLIRLAR